MSSLSLKFLGRFSAALEGQLIPTFRTNKVQAFLILLAVEPAPHRRDSLMTMLWPGMPERSARHNLRQALYHLRQVVPDIAAKAASNNDPLSVPLILANRQTIQLNPQADVEIDTGRFSALLNRVQLHGHSDLFTCQTCRESLEEAVALYTGDFLADFYVDDSNEFEEWAETSRQAFRRKALDALETLATINLRQKSYPQAQAYIEQQLVINNLRESAYRQLMEVHALNGRREEALAVYESSRELLAEEMGMAPSSQTTTLYEKIQAGDLHFQETQSQDVRGYDLQEEIGEGAYGTIYRAVQPVIGRDVAIKVIRRKFADDPQFIRRFEAEAQTIARLEHPYIVPLYDYWREPEGAYLVMRFFRGGNLLTLLDNGPWDAESAIQMLDQISSALTTAHRQGIVHRDIKPANILFDESRNAYLSDFGIAKDLSNDMQLTVAGAFVGTPDYTSPEQLLNEPVTPQADIYSLGALLYETLTGEQPFSDTSFAMRIQKQLQEPLPLVRSSQPDLPPQIDDVIQKATAKRAEDRYPDALAMAEAYRRAVRGSGNGYAGIPLAVPAGLEIINPYKGLRAFQESDASDFFGREILIQQLVTRLEESRFLAVVGPSGSGKSSLVKAGLIPALRQDALPGSEKWFVTEMVPGTHPLEELELALLPIAVDPPPSLVEPMQKDERGLLRTIRRILPDEEDAQLLLLIDQFEELFTLVDDDKRRQHFLNSLLTALTAPRSPLRVIVTLRADFYDRPLQIQPIADLFKRHTEVILPLTREELSWAIQEPAQQMGVGLESSVVTAMVADVADQPGALPLLQYALTELFDERQDNIMTLPAYETLGGVSGALAQRAEELFDGLDEAGQEAARQLFLRLVTLGEGSEDTRRRVLQSELIALQTSELSESSEVLDIFGRYRLLTFDHDPVTREPTVEVAHEALLREWPRLRGWLEQSRDDVRLQRLLAAAAAEWALAGKETGFLLRGSRLDLFENWATEMDLALTPDEQVFLDTSLAARRQRETEEAARRQQELETAQKLAATEKARATAEQQRAEEQAQAAAGLRQRAFYLSGALIIAALLAIAAIFFANQSGRNETEALAAAEQRATAQANAEEQQKIAEEQKGIAVAQSDSRATAQAQAETSENEALAQRATAVAEADFRATAEAEAVVERNFAEEQSRLSTSRELAAAALNNLKDDPELSILLALQAMDNAHTFEAESALHTAIQNSAVRQTFYHAPDSGASFITVNPNGNQFFVSGANGGTMWDLTEGEVQYPIEVPEGDWINSADFTPDGAMLILPGETWEGDTAVPSSVTFIDAPTGQELVDFIAHDSAVQAVAVSPDNSHFVSLTWDDGPAKLWDLEATLAEGTGQLVHELCCLENGGARGRFSPDSSTLATVTGSREVMVWDVSTGENLFTLEANDARDVDFSPDGRYLVTASQGMIEVWDAASGERLSIELAHDDSSLRSINFTPDGQFLTVTSRNQISSLWRFSEGNLEKIRDYTGHKNETFDSNIMADGRFLLTTSSGDGTARLWSLDPRDAVELDAITTHEDILVDLHFTGDGAQLVSGATDGLLKVWDTASGEELQSIQAHETWINRVAVSPDGQTLATAGKDALVKLWDKESGRLLHALEGHEEIPEDFYGGVIDVAFSPDGRLVGTAGTDGLAMVWDVETSERLLTINGHNENLDVYERGTINGITFSPEGRFLATASADGTVRLWDSETGEELLVLSNDNSEAYWSLDINPDGSHLLATRRDLTGELWQLPEDLWADEPGEATLIDAFETAAGFAFSSAFSPDGRKMALSGERGVVEVRDAQTAEVMLALQLPTFVNCVAFTPDSKGLAACSDDGIARFFTVDLDELLQLAHERVTRPLTDDECQRYLHVDSCQ